MITTPKDFSTMAFGPWSDNDPKIQRTIVRTNAKAGSLRNRFQATYPPAPTVAQTKTAITGGFEFAINVVPSPSIAGYNIYSSTTNNAAVAKLIRFLPQPKVTAQLQSIKFQDITAATPFYWVASTNSAGRESSRTPIAGSVAPMPAPTGSAPAGGGSGSAGTGGRGGGGRLPNTL